MLRTVVAWAVVLVLVAGATTTGVLHINITTITEPVILTITEPVILAALPHRHAHNT